MRRTLLLVVVSVVVMFSAPSRAQFCPGVSPWVFDDVAASDPFCGYITWMAQNGISLGCQVIDANHRLYCPSGTVSRAAMAAFMNRLGNIRVEAVGTGPGLTGGPITGIGTINLAATNLLPTTACATNQIARWNGSAWVCSTDANSGGTVTSVGSGTGLSGGPITASGTLSIATGYQLPQGCSNGQVPKSNGAGTWTCAADANGGGTVTSVTAGAGLTGGTITTSGTIAVDPASGTLTGNFFKQGGNAFGALPSATAVLGTNDGNAIDVRVNGARVMRYEPNAVSPNVIGGSPANSVSAGVRGATIGGGASSASATDPDYGAGVPNRVTDAYGTVGGGFGNVAGNGTGTVSDAAGATVAGGVVNQATGKYATVGGGNGNSGNGYASTVAGGNNNLVSGDWAGIAGGIDGIASGIASVVSGGQGNLAGGAYSSVAGGYNTLALGTYSTVSGGTSNTASNTGAAIGGGSMNVVTGQFGSIGGGSKNNASGQYSTVGGGFSNTAGGELSTVIGGGSNVAPGFAAAVLGGSGNSATSSHAVAAGFSASADQVGCFVFANWSASGASCLGLSRVARFALDHGLSVDYHTPRPDGGGTRWIYIGDALANGMTISAWNGAGLTDAGVWANASDRALKDGFAPVDPRQVLEGVIALPVTRWRYRTETPGVSHIGPTAQDFKAAFGLGSDDKSIGTVDSEGVALAAIQGLNAKLEAKVAEQSRELDAQRSEIASLKAAYATEVAELKRAVEVLLARTFPEGRIAAK